MNEPRWTRHLTFSRILTVVCVILVLKAGGHAFVLARELTRSRAAIERLVKEQRESAAAFELEINTLEIEDGLLTYLSSGDPAGLARLENAQMDYSRWLAVYRDSADDGDAPKVQRLEGLYRELVTLGQQLIEEAGAPIPVERIGSSRVAALGAAINDLLDEEVQRDARADMSVAAADVTSSIERMRINLVVSFSLLIVFLALLVVSSAVVVRRSFDRLLAGTRAIASGDLGYRIGLDGASEVAVLGRAIERMGRDLRESMISRDELADSNRRLEEANDDLREQVTRRRVAEDQRYRIERRYRRLFMRSPIALLLVKADGTIIECNATFARVLGRGSARLIPGRRLEEVVEGSEVLAGMLDGLRAEGSSAAVELRPKGADQARIFRLEAVPVLVDEDRKQNQFEISLLDITEFKQAETSLYEQLERAAEEWSWTFDSINDLVIVTDEENRILRINEAARMRAGRGHSECVGRLVGEVFEQMGTRIEEIAEVSQREQSAQTGAVHDRATGVMWSILVSPRISDGGAHGVVAVARDATYFAYVEELEAAVRKSRRLAEMGSFVAGVAHEVRNPLFGITSNLDALEVASGPNVDPAEYSRRIRAEVDRLSDLMRDLLDFARPSELPANPVPVQQVVSDAIMATKWRAREAGVTIESEIDPTLSATIMSARRMRQALQNLIENAVSFSPHGSIVHVEAFGSEDAHGHRSVSFAVSDRGPGLRQDDLDHVFEPFFTQRQGGTGLGLSIVRRIAEDHGGTATISNGEGGGARALITVPLADTPHLARDLA